MPDARPWKVLLVEDSDIYRDALRGLLVKRFPLMEVIEAEDLTEARSKLRRHAPALVFLDIGLPDGNGFDLLREIREDRPLPRVVICTSHDLSEYRNAALRWGADGFLVKHGIDWGEVAAIVQRVFGEEGGDWENPALTEEREAARSRISLKKD